MEVSMFSGYPDLGMMNNDLNYFNNQLQVNSLEELLESSLLPSYGNSFEQLESNQGLVSCKRSPQNDVHQTTFIENPIKKLKTNNNWESYDHQMSHILNSSQDQHDSNSTIISFSNSSNSSSQTSTLITPKEEAISNNNSNSFGYPPFHHEMVVNQEKQGCIFESRPHHQVVDKKSIKVGSNMPSQAMDHIMAERKRREKLSQRFIALSAVIPGLKKMDKASVLGDAIKYVKQMQEKVKKLEEEAKKRSVESAVFVNRSYVSAEENDDQFSEKSTATDNNAAAATSCCKASFPEIEVRFSDKDVLITAHCEPKKGMFEKLISKIEKLHLSVVCSSSLAFGNSALAVTITAQMDAEYSMTAKDLVRHLHSTLK